MEVDVLDAAHGLPLKAGALEVLDVGQVLVEGIEHLHLQAEVSEAVAQGEVRQGVGLGPDRVVLDQGVGSEVPDPNRAQQAVLTLS